MGYSDQKYIDGKPIVFVAGTATYGALASAGVGTVAGIGVSGAAGFLAPKAMTLTGITATCVVAPGTSIQPHTLDIIDGTNTMGTVVLTTAAAAGTATGALSATAANLLAAKGDQITFNVHGTATTSVAAGQATGQYNVVLMFRDTFV